MYEDFAYTEDESHSRVETKRVDECRRYYPYSCVVRLYMKINGQDKFGSGILIGPNVVLTAGHNILNAD